MPLLNYTTKVPVRRSADQIQALLAKAGANQVLTEYGPSGQPVGFAFQIETSTGLHHYHLPADTAAVYRVLQTDDTPSSYCTPEQAERIAWRILKDWLEAQLAIVATEMVAFDQVMLPYMRSVGGQTVYQLYLDQQLALPVGSAS